MKTTMRIVVSTPARCQCTPLQKHSGYSTSGVWLEFESVRWLEYFVISRSSVEIIPIKIITWQQVLQFSQNFL